MAIAIATPVVIVTAGVKVTEKEIVIVAAVVTVTAIVILCRVNVVNRNHAVRIVEGTFEVNRLRCFSSSIATIRI